MTNVVCLCRFKLVLILQKMVAEGLQGDKVRRSFLLVFPQYISLSLAESISCFTDSPRILLCLQRYIDI